MEKQDYNWNSFQLRIPINADKRLIFDRCITQKGLESWFLRKAAFFDNSGVNKENQAIEAGDQYEWLWHGWPDETVETTAAIPRSATSAGITRIGAVMTRPPATAVQIGMVTLRRSTSGICSFVPSMRSGSG